MLRRELQPQPPCHVPFSLLCPQKPQCCVSLTAHHLWTCISFAECDWGRRATLAAGAVLLTSRVAQKCWDMKALPLHQDFGIPQVVTYESRRIDIQSPWSPGWEIPVGCIRQTDKGSWWNYTPVALVVTGLNPHGLLSSFSTP